MDYRIGDSASLTRTFSGEDVESFSHLSLDFNPLHLDEEYAKNGIFKKRICHGFLVSSLISAVLGTKLPGDGSIYLDQSLKFIRPVFWGDTITANVEIVEIQNEKNIINLKTVCLNQMEKIVIEGMASMLVLKK